MSKLFNVEAWITQYHGNTDFAKDHYASGTHRGLDCNPINRNHIPDDSADWNVYTPISGEVMSSGFDDNYGINCVIYSDWLRASLHFAHLKSVFVNNGDIISKGGMIGVVGNTGNSTSRHLHIGYIPMDPYGTRLFDDSSNPYNGALDPLGFLIAQGVDI